MGFVFCLEKKGVSPSFGVTLYEHFTSPLGVVLDPISESKVSRVYSKQHFSL
uniref:Uncharacterized protein n=1 Tax=Rhizophora mucronata TaxID=61149 RepID=A0A2P2INC9_RHIMU